jgi:CheY-like chemotaxis protein
MKVLVVDHSAVDLLLVAGCLRDLGHEVRTASNRREAITHLAQALPQVVIVEAFEADAAGLEVVRMLRGLETPHYIYIIMLTGEVGEERLLPGYEAGVDNHARKPVSREQLAARLIAAARIFQVDAGARGTPAEPDRAAPGEPRTMAVKPVQAPIRNEAPRPSMADARSPATAPKGSSTDSGSSSVDVVARTSAWLSAPGTLLEVAGEFFPVPFSLGHEVSSESPAFSSFITLSSVEPQIEMRVLVAASEASARTLTQRLLGEDNLELATDMLSELAHLLMESLKGSFSKEAVAFTGDIPKPDALERFRRWHGRAEHSHEFVLRSDGAELAVVIGLRTKLIIVIPVSALREDMVVAKDIVHANGVLLLPGGTRLSAATAERVRRILPIGSVELMDPDDVLEYLAERYAT